MAEKISRNFPQKNRMSQILVDISSGEGQKNCLEPQTSVRSILKFWLKKHWHGWRVEPVRIVSEQNKYNYAREETGKLLWNRSVSILDDGPVDYAAGDIFLILNFSHDLSNVRYAYLQKLRWRGVRLIYAVHSCPQIQKKPDSGSSGNSQLNEWLEALAASDGVICASKAVADELRQALDVITPKRAPRTLPLEINWFNFGSNNDLPEQLTPLACKERAVKLMEQVLSFAKVDVF